MPKSHIWTKMMHKLNHIKSQLINEFTEILKIEWIPDVVLNNEFDEFLELIGNNVELLLPQERRRRLLRIIRSKLDLNEQNFRTLINELAKQKIYLHYHEKEDLLKFLNENSYSQFSEWLEKRKTPINFSHAISSLFQDVSELETLKAVEALILQDTAWEQVLSAIFGSYIYSCFDEKNLHRKLNSECELDYLPDFWNHLLIHYPKLLNRECGLTILRINKELVQNYVTYEDIADKILSIVRQAYFELSNHCYLGVIVEPMMLSFSEWDLISDIILFAEKFLERPINTGYFRWQKVQSQTKDHIPDLDTNQARFDLGNEGFYFKDCMIFTQGSDDNDYSCLILFEKNERDETLIPCPACRSKNVRGNSYPVLGVKSWECQNQFCPDRSKYNRGKRYSLVSLIRQKAILDERNCIPREYLKKWRRDILYGVSITELTEMLIRLYSLAGDNIVTYGIYHQKAKKLNRIVEPRTLDQLGVEIGLLARFYKLHFFNRYKIKKRNNPEKILSLSNISKYDGLEVYCGDAFNVLEAIESQSIDGVVTSPPYYNAKDYSNWPNIYCYLYDMLNIGKEIYRVLKDGSPFIFNIFDYFDNENNIVFSAMGKKRMILGYYFLNIFKEIGFQLCANIPWDKGEIEGNRNFNQGNNSPYYQAPHNCWEHIFVLSKGEPNFSLGSLPSILKAQPVLKIVNGVNTLGHSAPFPQEIPLLLINLLGNNVKILDPFSGSMTTGRSAHRAGIRSINVDYKNEYCELGLSILEKELKTNMKLPLVF